MKTLFLGCAAAIALAGCATEGGGYTGFGGGWSTAYYDDYYGPFYDGYWAGDVFWYRPAHGRPFVRDEGHHFRHDPGSGFHGVRGHFHMNHGGAPSGRPGGAHDHH